MNLRSAAILVGLAFTLAASASCGGDDGDGGGGQPDAPASDARTPQPDAPRPNIDAGPDAPVDDGGIIPDLDAGGFLCDPETQPDPCAANGQECCDIGGGGFGICLDECLDIPI